MTDETASAELELDAQALWSRYEDIAMHFNDLLMRLRSQSLAGIAAAGTLVGLFTKTGIADLTNSWLAAALIFFALALVWVAIWCLDFLYYNRLLTGAVAAIIDIETQSKGGKVTAIQMSTTIEAEFAKPLNLSRFGGVLWFYMIVLTVLLASWAFCSSMFYHEALNLRHAHEAASHVAVSNATHP